MYWIFRCTELSQPPRDNDGRPAVVFVAGSGPTDRDWCSPLLTGKNGSAKILAEALAEQGFLTIRYDKIASGPHVRENVPKFSGKISMKTHVEELSGVIETILSENKMNSKKLFALTNSEGAIHAVNYQLQATKNQFKGLGTYWCPREGNRRRCSWSDFSANKASAGC